MGVMQTKPQFLSQDSMMQSRTCPDRNRPRGKSPTCLVTLVSVPDEKPQEVEPGAFSDEDEVGRPISQVGGRGEAPGAPGTSTGHVCGVDGQELPADDLPLFQLL